MAVCGGAERYSFTPPSVQLMYYSAQAEFFSTLPRIIFPMTSNNKSPLYKEILVTEQQLDDHIDKMADDLIRDFAGKNPLFICLLRGGIPFASRLMFAITKRDPHFFPEMDYMTVSRYGEKLTGSAIRVVMDVSPKTNITDRPVIVVDDVIDKGKTYEYTKQLLEQKGASRVYLAACIQREIPEPRAYDADYYCFSVDTQDWLVGMGLDDPRLGREANRWASWVATTHPSD